jgi:hypothetical protein
MTCVKSYEKIIYFTIPKPKLTIMTSIRAKVRLKHEITSATKIAPCTIRIKKIVQF